MSDNQDLTNSMWNHCRLSGLELDCKIAELEGLPYFQKHFTCWLEATENTPTRFFGPSEYWNDIGPIIHRDQIFLRPPHDMHVVGGPNAGWNHFHVWTATVSARIRTYTNQNGVNNCVGRGCGETPMLAAARAYVVSKIGDQ